MALIIVYFLAVVALGVFVESACDPEVHECGDWRRGAFIVGMMPGALPVFLFAVALAPEGQLRPARGRLARAVEGVALFLVLVVGILWGGLLVVWGVGNLIQEVVTYEFTALDAAVWLYVALAGFHPVLLLQGGIWYAT